MRKISFEYCCIDALLERNPAVAPDEVEDVIVGAASHAGEQDGNLARLAVVLSKLPITTAGMTITASRHNARDGRGTPG